MGVLTKYLLKNKSLDLKVIEIDRDSVAYLTKHFEELAGRIVEGDFLESDLNKIFEGAFSIIGNFPYNISSPILFKILEWEPDVNEVIGMFQKEVALRIASGPGSKVYGILSVLMQAFYKVEYLFEVHENCFTPPPKVKSGVLRFTNTHNPHNITDKKKFISIVKTAFNQRRKTLRNALKSMAPADLLLHPIMEKRAEQLSVNDFAWLYNEFINGKYL
jgi:16S rRNA (adenine1518-N6/adenine1519-N6)-dimethyltransferase